MGAENIFGPYAFAAFSLFGQSGSAMLQREKGRAAKIALGLKKMDRGKQQNI